MRRMTEPIDPPQPAARARRRWPLLAAALGLGALALVLAWQFAARQLQQAIVETLGSRSEVASVGLAWGGVEITGLRVKAAPGSGWPAADELRAARVLVAPDLWAALRGQLAVRRIVVEDGYIALLRRRDGRLQALPSLLGRPPAAAGQTAPPLRVGQLQIERSELVFFDASVRRPPLPVRLTGLAARIGPLGLPALDEATQIDLQAGLAGSPGGPDGRIELRGHVVTASREGSLQAKLRRVDLLALQPYVNRVAEGGVKRGTLDLDIAPTVKGQQLNAPGRLSLSGLELGSGGFAGLPRQALLAFVSRNERIELDFTLEGRLDDPAFSLNESLAVRVTAGLAEQLGLSVGSVVEGVGSVIKGLFGR